MKMNAGKLYELENNDILYLDPEEYFENRKYSIQTTINFADISKQMIRRYYVLKSLSSKNVILSVYFGIRIELLDKERLIDIAHKLQINVYKMSQE